ncbi:hypothetical protein [Streptomyces sp. Wb2n-11]|uniref:hypothetical protein n=1 Tax=Streptomyces sp. Wb2n-11 TaxID=1030533 RepID=UPI00210047BA|nr:hypothetical protein [Streptomyces sp. Wb2n-11]
MTTDPTIPSTADDDDRSKPPDAVAAYMASAYAAAAEAGTPESAQEAGDEPIRTLLWTAATHRPLDEVAALVSLLHQTGAVPSPGDEALRAAAVARPLDEVRQLVALLNEHPHEVDEAGTTLRAAAVGRPIEDVAQLVSILGADDGDHRHPAGAATVHENRTAPGGERTPDGRTTGDQTAAPPVERPDSSPGWPTNAPQSAVPVVGDVLTTGQQHDDTSSVLRSVLRWSAALALFACGLIHLPTDFAHLRSGGYADALSVAVTVFCLVLGMWLAVRDTARVWAASAATAIGIVALHVLANIGTMDLLESSLGESFAWADAAAVSFAAFGAVISSSALLRRQRKPDATNST